MTHLKCLITAYRSADHLAYTSLLRVRGELQQQQPHTNVHFSFQSTTDSYTKYTMLLLHLYEVRKQYSG